MAAVTENKLMSAKNPGGLIQGLAAAENLYANTIAFFDASTGYITGDDNGGANAFAGIVKDQVDNSAGSAGDLAVELYTSGVWELVGSSFTQATAGVLIYAIDNYTVQTSATTATKIGRCVEYVSSTNIGVLIDVAVT